MPTSDNILQQVITYQESGLVYLQNLNCFIGTANTKFKDFDKIEANLGSTVSFDLPPRFVTTNSLVATFQPAAQRVHNLVCDQSANTSYAFSAEQFTFNVRDYMEKFGKSAIEELGAKVEANVAEVCVTAPYRFYGDGVTQINSYGQLAAALAMFRNYGSAKGKAKGYLSDIVVPGIVNSGLQQFAIDRNNKIAMSWELGEFSRCDWYQSNLLPIHIAGSEGQAGSTLTVVSVTKNADDAVISITFSGTSAANDADSVKIYDKFQFNDGVANQPNLRYRTFVGHEVSANPVQFKATANAASTAGSQVTVLIDPPLKASSGRNQNINFEIAAGMQVSVLPSHRAGMITAGDPLFLAMPRLPEEVPFPTASKSDADTGVALRMYYGSLFGQNQQGMVHDVLWGKTLPGEYAMSLIFPL
jgi:hypothetical protein